MKRRLRGIAQLLCRGGEKAQAQVDRLTADIALRAHETLRKAERTRAVARGIRKLGPLVGSRYAALRRELVTYVQRVRWVRVQTRLRLQGVRSIPNRLVSLFDPDVRPIRRGKLAKPVEFGYKLGRTETQEGFITQCQLRRGNPSDEAWLVDLVGGHMRVTGAKPHGVPGDRGMSSQANEAAFRAMGIAQVGLPARGKLTPERRLFERRRAFRGLTSLAKGPGGPYPSPQGGL